MDKRVLKEYLEKLESFEKILSETDEGEVDNDFIKDIENTLSQLTNDAVDHIQQNDPTVFTGGLSSNLNNGILCKIKKVHPNAVVPTYSKDGDAGMDVTSTEIISDTESQVTYGTGIAVEIPKGYVGLVFPRSSIRKYELELSNSVGVIDSGYRGEIQATFNKTNGLHSVKYEVGDRIFQIMILPHPTVTFNLVDELSDTERGEGGFGSTGK
jgi:dUTP pyrophosphatase